MSSDRPATAVVDQGRRPQLKRKQEQHLIRRKRTIKFVKMAEIMTKSHQVEHRHNWAALQGVRQIARWVYRRGSFSMFSRKGRLANVVADSRSRAKGWRVVVALAGGSEAIKSDLVRVQFRHLCVTAAVRHVREELVVLIFSQLALLAQLALSGWIVINMRLPSDVKWFVLSMSFFASVLPAVSLVYAHPRTRLGRVVLCLLVLSVELAAGSYVRGSLWDIAWLSHGAGRLRGYPAAGFAALALGALMFLAMTAISGAFLIFYATIVKGRELRRYPDVAALDPLMRLIISLRRGPAVLASLETRKGMSDDVEMVARIIEQGFGRMLQLPSPSHNAALQDKLAAMAAAVRSFELRLALPEFSTLDDTKRMVTSVLVSFCTGKIGLLPVAPSFVASAQRRLGTILFGWLRSTAVALVPIIVILVLNRFGVLRFDAFGYAVTVGAIIWALVCLLVAIDPLFAVKFGVAKELLVVLRGQSSKK